MANTTGTDRSDPMPGRSEPPSALLGLPAVPFRRMSLNRLLLIAVFIALLPTAILSIYLSFSGRNQARQLIAERLIASAAATAAMQHESISMVERIMTDFARTTDVRTITASCDAALARGLRARTSAGNFSRIDAQGQLRCSALPITTPFNVADTSWWREGRSSRRLTFSPPQYGRFSARPVIIAMLPLQTATGRFDGAVTAAIDASSIERMLASRAQSDDVIVALADREGRLLIANRPNALPATPVMRDSSVKTISDATGSEWLFTSSPVWRDQLHIVYAEPLMPLVAPITDQLRLSIALPLATIVLSCLAIWFAMYLFAERWLSRLRVLIAQLADGDYSIDRTIFRSAPADIAMLADDMHRMAQSIEQRDTALRSSAEARLALVGEVNHRVKNNLQMIISLISLQASKINDPVAKTALDQMRMRIAALALIYRSLYEEEGESEQGNVDVDRLIAILAEQLRASSTAPNVRVMVNSAIGIRPVDEVIPLAMFAVEALTNALRHAFPGDRAGAISVEMAMADQMTSLSISDNGVGYVATDRAGEFGATLINAYARQLGGTVTIRSDGADGTKVDLVYPGRARLPGATPLPDAAR